MEANGRGTESEKEEDDLMHMKYNDDGNDDGEAEDDDVIDLSNIMDLHIGDECPLPTSKRLGSWDRNRSSMSCMVSPSCPISRGVLPTRVVARSGRWPSQHVGRLHPTTRDLIRSKAMAY